MGGVLTVCLVGPVWTVWVSITLPGGVDAVPGPAHELPLVAVRPDRHLWAGVLVRAVQAVEIPVATPTLGDALAVQTHELRRRTRHVRCNNKMR